MKRKYRYKGFTLIEILLTITLIGILAAITLVAINPNLQIGQSRDLNRQKDITDIQKAVELYGTRNSGEYPLGVEKGIYKEICGEISNENCVDLSVLVPEYINNIPTDPSGNNYFIGINPSNDSVSVWAKNAEQREVAINLFLLTGIKDLSFDTGTPTGFGRDVNVTIIQPDGKIIVGGEFTFYQGVTTNRIIRLNSDGTKDNTFDIGTGFNESVEALALQSDGKIIVGGRFSSYQGVESNRIIRLNSNVSRDDTFDMGSGFSGDVRVISLQSDGKIIVGGGFSSYQGVSANRIIRLNSNGSRDNTFDMGVGFNSTLNTIALQSDGKIIVGGSFTSYQGVEANRIIRLNSDGSRDTSFDIGNGFTLVNYTGRPIVYGINALIVQPDGKIIVGGGVFNSYQGVEANKIIRLNSNGSRDNTFDMGVGFNSTLNTIALQSDGKIIVGGSFNSYQGISANRIININNNGSVNNEFVLIPPNTNQSFNNNVNTIALQSDGKLLVGGEFTSYKGVVANRIIRLNSDGSKDIAFNIEIGFNGPVNTIALQSDGKLLVGGEFTSYKGVAANRIIRLNSDGNRDSSFSLGTGFNGIVNTITLQSDSKILVGGRFINYQGVSANRIIRLNSNGTRDNSFAIGTGFEGFRDVEVKVISVQSDGKIIVGGGEFDSYQGVSANRIIRLNGDGSRDTSFDIGTGFNQSVTSIALQSDGKIIIGGGFTSYKGVGANRIIRLNSNGSKDNSFILGTGFNDWVAQIILQSDGKIIVGGDFTVYQGKESSRIIRLNTGGSVDNSLYTGLGFNDNLTFVRLVTDPNAKIAFAIQPDGKLIVGGDFTVYQNQPAGYLIRIIK